MHSILDNKVVDALACSNGGLGRLGGLLKLWLTDDTRAEQYGRRLIHALLPKIENTQDLMLGIMLTVVMPRAVR